MEKVKHSFSIAEAADLSDLSERMIDYLCRTKIIAATARRRKGRGNRRLFSFGDVLLLRSVHHLLERGVSVSRMRDHLKDARARYKGLTPTAALPSRFIITNGERAYFESENGVIELIRNPDQYVFKFILDLEHTRGEILNKMAAGL